jgi:hypothetical protein
MWIITAWQHMSPKLMGRVLKRAVYPNAVDETDVGMLWKGSNEDSSVRSECEEDEGTNCEGGER